VTEPVLESAARRPLPPLRPFVERYSGYRMAGFRPGLHRGLPSRHLTFIISLAGPVEIAAMPDILQAPAALSAFVGGLHNGPAAIVHDGTQVGVSLSLTPFGARGLLGVPAGELAGRVIDLEALLGADAGRLADRLHTAAGWEERFALLDTVLLERLGRVTLPPVRPEIEGAFRRLVAADGGVDIATLAAQTGWSRRHLAERFRAEIGLPPKVLARVARFDRARRLLGRSTPPAEVAALTGYYDQAHLNRDFKEMAGCSPTTWLAEELPIVQDSGAAGGAR
jgi:AraC-like DNA-binding protein